MKYPLGGAKVLFPVVSGLGMGHISGEGVVSIGCLDHLCCFWEREGSNAEMERRWYPVIGPNPES